MQTLHCLTSHFCKRKPCYFPTHQWTSFPPTHFENYRFALRLPGNSLSFHPPTQTHTFSSNDHECKLRRTHAFTHSLYLLLPLEGAPILWVLSVLPEFVFVYNSRLCVSAKYSLAHHLFINKLPIFQMQMWHQICNHPTYWGDICPCKRQFYISAYIY